MRHFILIIVCFALAQNANAQDSCSFKSLFIGHAYGSQNNNIPQWNSINQNIEKLKQQKPDYIFFLGDFLRDSLTTSIEQFTKLSDGFHTSVRHIRGNHDKKWFDYPTIATVYDREERCWEKWLFSSVPIPEVGFSSVTIRKERQKSDLRYIFVPLDTENPKDNLDSIIKSYVKYSQPVIIFLSHRLIWAYSNPRYAHLVELTNSPKMHQLPQVVDMDFLNQQKDKKFYFFAGDLGVNIPLFYDKVGNVTMYAVGCGGTPKDAALLAEFKRDTILTSLVHLGTANYNIEDYSLEKINAMPLPNVTISAQQGFKGYQWPIVLGIFALMALALYMVVTPNE